MKTNSFYLILLAIFGIAISASAASDYGDILGSSLKKLDSAVSISDYEQCRTQFEQMSQLYPDEWLPVYYTAYCNINITFINVNATDKSKLLDDALKQLEKLDKYANIDLSELSTLWAYYYLSLVASDPASNGVKFQNFQLFCNKAIEQNPENPRPVCLKAFFNQYVPDFMRSDSEIKEGKNKAEMLFAKEEQSIYKPYWGIFFLQMINK